MHDIETCRIFTPDLKFLALGVATMNRKILTFGGFFESFYNALEGRVQRKIDYALELLKTEERVSVKFVKHLRGG